MDMIASNELVYLPVEQLVPHPDNPRTELGDLTELAASIRMNGVYQNLTVVPAEEGYTIIIGHRRAAAAKLAGLDAVPCVIANMDEAQQLRTMLTENMQRSDLTPIEEAKAVQMMLDLGDSLADIAEKTGLSESTVRRRAKLNELNPLKLNAAQMRGGTLAGYAKLDRVESAQDRNALLDAIGTPMFETKLSEIVRAQERAKQRVEWERVLSAFAAEVPKPDYSVYTSAGLVYLSNDPQEYELPADAADVSYYYSLHSIKYGYICLLKDKPRTSPADEDKRRLAEEAEQRRREGLKEASRNAAKRRIAFAESLTAGDLDVHMDDVVEAYLRYSDEVDLSVVRRLFETATGEEIGDEESLTELALMVSKVFERSTAQALWLLTLAMRVDNDGYAYFYSWNCSHYENDNLTEWYDLLESLGYEMSEEEQQLQDGTHPLFREEAE